MTSSILTTLPTLRSRLTLFYIASTTVAFLLLSILFSGLLWVALHNQIDHHIHIVTTQAEQVVNSFDGSQEELLLDNLVRMEGMSVLIVNSDGDVLMQKNSPDISPLSPIEIQGVLEESIRIGHHPIHFTTHNQRFGSAEVIVDGKPTLLAVGYSTKILKDTFSQMVEITFGVIVVILLPLTFLGHKLLRRYLYPLEVVAKTAQEITHPKKLSARVTGLPLTQEVSTIVTSFNGMLGRLETIFTSEHEFFSDAAHTLKTPLAVLKAKVEGLTKESDAKKQEMIQVIDATVDTVQDLLLISRIETGIAGSAKKVNLSAVVKELTELTHSLVQEKAVKVIDDIQSDINFNGDERLIKKAFGNVVHNAVQYVGETGSIHLLLKTDRENVVFEIINSGTGIPPNELGRVFERFYRGSNAQGNPKGSGLGLAISKAVVESFKGRIEIKSDNLKTSVKLTMPVGIKLS